MCVSECVCVPVHVAVGGERLSADVALVGPLPAVDQHVAVQRRGRAQALSADAAGVVRGAGVRVVLQGGEGDCAGGHGLGGGEQGAGRGLPVGCAW